MPRIAIITSTQCVASMNVRERLLESGLFEKADGTFEGNAVFSFKGSVKEGAAVYDDIRLYLIGERLIFFEDPEQRIDADLFIFLSKHRAKSGIPSVTVHVTGNVSKAEFGGRDRSLCIAPALWMHKAYRCLADAAGGSRYDAIMEATHHGPYSEKPVMFLELGSLENEWVDPEGGKIVVHALLRLLNEGPSQPAQPSEQGLSCAVGLGGLHHVPVLIKGVQRDQYALGHVVPKHQLDALDEAMLHQAMDRTDPPASLVVLDWKGLGAHKQRLRKLLDDAGIAWQRSDKQ